MAKIWEPKSKDVLMDWIHAIAEEHHKLDEWERKFVGNMAIAIANNAQLSRAQEEKLEQIYANKTS